jgi:hypothetical protein
MKAIVVVLFGKVTRERILKICREVFKAKDLHIDSGNGRNEKIKGLCFSQNKCLKQILWILKLELGK